MRSPATGSSRSTDPARAASRADILEHEFVEWVQGSNLLKRAFREVAVIGGLVERQHPGQAQDRAGRSPSRPTSSTTCCAATSPTICCSSAAWDDARARMTDVGRLARLLDRAAGTMVHVELDRVSPMAVPVLVMIGRERAATGTADDSC